MVPSNKADGEYLTRPSTLDLSDDLVTGVIGLLHVGTSQAWDCIEHAQLITFLMPQDVDLYNLCQRHIMPQAMRPARGSQHITQAPANVD